MPIDHRAAGTSKKQMSTTELPDEEVPLLATTHQVDQESVHSMKADMKDPAVRDAVKASKEAFQLHEDAQYGANILRGEGKVSCVKSFLCLLLGTPSLAPLFAA